MHDKCSSDEASTWNDMSFDIPLLKILNLLTAPSKYKGVTPFEPED